MALDFNISPSAFPQPEPAKPSGMANVTIRVDADAFMLCDGEYMENLQLKAGVISKTQLPVGQHLLEFISSDNPDIKVEKQVDFPLPNRSYLVLVNELKALVDKRTAQVEQQRQAEEAERKLKTKDASAAMDSQDETDTDDCSRQESLKQKFEEGRRIVKRGGMDYNRGLEMIKTASKEGLAEASKFLAFGFAYGHNGIKKEEELAGGYYLAFIKQAKEDDEDLPRTYDALGAIYAEYERYSSSSSSKKANRKQAEEYYEQAVKLGYYKSIFHLAELYHGWNERKSLKYYLEYLSKGDQTIYEYVQSCLVVGRKYYDGEGTNIDKEKAFTYWKKGAELGEARCLHRIEKYFKGRLTDSELRQLNKGLEGRLLI